MNGGKNKTVRLSERMRAVAGLVTPGNIVADVGCDHGFVSVYLAQSGTSPHVVAMDVREGPLAAARVHIREYGLEDRIETRLSDGLAALQPGEAQSLVCAGMGGALMQRILTAEPEKTASFGELILQPQSELADFRIFLRTHGFSTQQERILCEDGKYYFLFRVVPGEGEPRETMPDRTQRLYDCFGRGLLEEKNETLREYLTWRLEQTESIGRALQGARRETLRARENQAETELLREAMEYIRKGD